MIIKNAAVQKLTKKILLIQSFWKSFRMGPSDAILGIAESFKQCTDPRKVNVAVGAYRDDDGKPWILPSVRAAERILWEQNENKEYLPIEGDTDFLYCAMKFAYGTDFDLARMATVQTLSGTGACRVGGCFLSQFWPKHPIYVPNPTWGNHITIFHDAGLAVQKYRYYSRETNGLDLLGMLSDIENAPNGSIILLHACAHNPTGCDPTIDEWKQIIKVISNKEHIAFFDSAYQGFASGDAEADAQPFRYAVSQSVPILLAQSFAKNFGLYGERCGTLSIVCGDIDQKERVMSELRCIIRPMYSSPPRHGSSIVKTILLNDKLKQQYYLECQLMANRIQQMRLRLVEALKDVGSEHDWSHVTQQIGMFAFTGLSESMCERMTKEYAIFLTMNGRISIAGLNPSNVRYVAEAIHDVSHGQSISSP